MKIVFEPSLVDEIVHLASRDNPARLVERRFFEDKIYEQPVEERREGFYRVHLELMKRWQLDRPLAESADEFKALDEEIAEALVAAASPGKDEGADLSWDGQRVGIKLQPGRFMESHTLKVFFRHEFMHINDMLDRNFGYRMERFDLTPSQEDSVRARYGLLWDISIESRLTKAGKETKISREAWAERFSSLFSGLPEMDRLAVFERIWDAPLSRHSDILEKAIEPASLIGAEARPAPRAAGSKCPLCSFPSYQWVDAPSATLAMVQADFPRWRAEEGMCPRCSEYYAITAGIW